MKVKYIPKEKVTKACTFCGEEFDTPRDRQRFCSEECRKEFIRQINTFGKCPHCKKDLL
ncbi:hypothetical protein LCGC14_1642840 [marine sediment metagenome]|uniref:TRASH domain-containing protein n=1 Tax=marine sediment metagenome TaxID=412755 RepID=A0A0F9KYV7_9ZZZZ